MTTQQYVYKITSLLRVVDGDSIWLYLDGGFRMTLLVNLRLAGVDCPEMNSRSEYERLRAREAKAMTTQFLTLGGDKTWWVLTEKDPDSFGRWLGTIWREDFESAEFLGDVLVAAELATRWPTRWRDVYDNGQ